MDAEKKEERLKHLGFVRNAAIATLICLSSLYNYVKHHSGPVKPAVGAVEGIVTAVAEPVYRYLNTLPDKILIRLDYKVDRGVRMFEKYAPPVGKQVASNINSIMKKATETVQETIQKGQVDGPMAAAQYAASESKEFALTQIVGLCTKLDRITPFHVFAEIVVPTVAHIAQRYNDVVTGVRRIGFPVIGYLPLIPLDEIAMAFKQSAESNAQGQGVTAN